jgi:hypothetical protein
MIESLEYVIIAQVIDHASLSFNAIIHSAPKFNLNIRQH